MLKEQNIGQAIYRALDMVNSRAVTEFHLPPDTYIGPGAISRIGEALIQRKIRTVFVVIDETLDNLGLAEGMYRSFVTHNIKYCVYKQPVGEPQSLTVESAAKQAVDSNCDGMVAFGGGSALDAAKVIAMLAANPGLVVNDLLDISRIRQSRAPFVAVPTTAGTGSEATNVAVIIDSSSLHKRVIVHPELVPDLALIDACLMLRVPPFFTAATGIDALTHAIESYVAIHATPLTKALAYQAIRLIGEALPVATGQGSDIDARKSMALASYMAGVAFSNAGLGLTHSMAHQLGPAYNIPHGVANAILLPSVMKFNELVCKKSFSDIGLALTGEIMASEDVISSIGRMVSELGMPVNLAAIGADPNDFDRFAGDALLDFCLATNPRTVSKNQIIEVYKQAFEYQYKN